MRSLAYALALFVTVTAAQAAVHTVGPYSGVMTTIARAEADAGRRAEQAGDLKGAADAYSAAIAKLEPYAKRDDAAASWDLYLVLGSAHLDRARVQMQSRVPGRQGAASLVSNALVDDDLARSRRYLERAAELRPRAQGDAPYALDLNLGIASGLQGKYREGREHLERAAAKDPRRIDLEPLIAEMKQAEKARADKVERKAQALRSVVEAIGRIVAPKGSALAFALYDLVAAFRQ